MKVCIVGASGKLGQYMIQHSLDRGYEVVGVCRPASVVKLDRFEGRITVHPGATDDREVIVLVVLVPRGVRGYATGTAQAVLDYALPDARLVFSCGWHISLDGQDVYSWKLKALVNIAGPLAKLARFADLDDQVEACRLVFASGTRWTVVRGSDLEEGESRASRSGADTWATRSSQATSPGASTSRGSWSRHSRTTSSSRRRRRSSAASHPQHSDMPLLRSLGRSQSAASRTYGRRGSEAAPLRNAVEVRPLLEGAEGARRPGHPLRDSDRAVATQKPDGRDRGNWTGALPGCPVRGRRLVPGGVEGDGPDDQ
jgi:NAD(P)-dependent dehydrogenase (short-subunit alcohol dehydrogenase family)